MWLTLDCSSSFARQTQPCSAGPRFTAVQPHTHRLGHGAPRGTLAAQPALQHSASSDGYDPKGKSKVAPGSDGDFLALDMGNGTNAAGGEQFMQMQLMDNQQNSYMQQRSTAIESIESTISELGQIFSQLAHMVAEQRETVQRIDDNVMDVVDNVGGAQRELLRYYASVSSNRWLMLKIFGVLIVFFLLFILVS